MSRSCAPYLVLGVLCLPLAAAQNNSTTFALPPGYSDHNKTNLLCAPTKWLDMAVFFLGNYVAHAATVKVDPGESPLGTFLIILSALLFPLSGVFRGVNIARRLPILARTDLRRAARAGALCTVAYDTAPYPEGKVDPRSTKIHGFMSPLPRGFIVIQVPRSAGFLDDPPVSRGLRRKIKEVFNPAQPKSTVISSNYSQVKVVIAIGQALYGITTLYNARGDQIERYGYAAFGLTVVPYAYMSVVNLIANLLCPEYSAMYMIESRAMRDAAELITENLSSTDTVKPTRTATSRVQQLSSNAQKVPTTVTTRQNVDGDIALMPVTSRNSTEAHSQKRNNWQSAEDALRLSAHLDSEDQSGNLASSQAVPDDTERDEQSVALVPQIPAPTPGEVSRRKPFSGIVGTLDEKWDRAVSGDKDKIRADIHHDEEDGGQLLRTPVLKNMAQAFFGPLFWFISCTWIFDLVVWSPFICLPIAVVGGLSSFKPGTMSTPAQRTWTMTWLAFSMLIGIATKVRSSYALVLINPIAWFMSPSNLIGAPKMLYFSAASVLYGAPAIGGFVVVAQMLSAYGVCSKTS